MAEIRGYCAQCASKCATIATVDQGRLVAVKPDRDHPNTGFCVKAGAAPEIVHSPKRLRTPLKRTRSKTDSDPGWVEISWDEALATIARKLNEIKQASGAEAVAFSRPAPGGSQACDWAPYFERLARAFGSPNAVATSHICQWGRDTGSMYTYGTGLPTPHFEASRTIMIWGHNPESSHIQNWRRIREAQRRGAKLIVVDPRRTGTVERADLWVRLNPGSDTALALAATRLLIEENLFDREFVAHWTNAPFLVSEARGALLRARDVGLSETDDYVVIDSRSSEIRAVDSTLDPSRWGFEPALEGTLDVEGVGRTRTAFSLLRARVAPWTPSYTAERTGVPAEEIEVFARRLGTEGPVSYYTYNGVEQHVDTSETTRALCTLYALTGWLEAEGGNVSFIGAPASPVAGLNFLAPDQAAKRLGFRERPLSAARGSIQAYSLYDAILDGHPYRVRALVSFGGNLLLQNGDASRGRRAMEQLEFQVHADAFMNPSGETADIVLPTATPWETPNLIMNFGGGPDTMARVQYRPAVIAPLYESRTDVEVMAALAVALGIGDRYWDGDVEASFRAQLAPSGIGFDELRAHAGGIDVELEQPYRKYRQADENGRVAGFPTPTRKVEIYSIAYLDKGYDPLPAVQPLFEAGADFPLRLTSYKLAQYCHSQGRGIPALRRQIPKPFLEIHPATAAKLGIESGERVRLETPHGYLGIEALVTDDVAPGVVAAHTGWWEACEELGFPPLDPFTSAGSNLNLIMKNDVRDPISGSVPHKSYPCAVHKIAQPSNATGVREYV